MQSQPPARLMDASSAKKLNASASRERSFVANAFCGKVGRAFH
jgi:hypothetical protein